MDNFQVIDDCLAFINRSGVYSTVPVYRRAGLIYIKVGSGFLRCLASGSTSVSNVKVEELEEHPKIKRDALRLRWAE